jgi:hypothetical protein
MMRVPSSARRGLTLRSRYNASCFRRNSFSAASWARDRIAEDVSETRSRVTPRLVWSRWRAGLTMNRIVCRRRPRFRLNQPEDQPSRIIADHSCRVSRRARSRRTPLRSADQPCVVLCSLLLQRSHARMQSTNLLGAIHGRAGPMFSHPPPVHRYQLLSVPST